MIGSDKIMPYIQGKDRNQLLLEPMCLDDFIDKNSICRVIEAYVNSLDMSALGFKYSDTKTICNFRKDNAIALKKAFREFSLWCNHQDLYGRKLVAVDGTKTRANSNAKNIYSKKVTEKSLPKPFKKFKNI
jgi:transposase